MMGTHGTRCGQSLLKALGRPLFGDYKCPRCESTITENSYLEQLGFDRSLCGFRMALESCSPELLHLGQKLYCLITVLFLFIECVTCIYLQGRPLKEFHLFIQRTLQKLGFDDHTMDTYILRSIIIMITPIWYIGMVPVAKQY